MTNLTYERIRERLTRKLTDTPVVGALHNMYLHSHKSHNYADRYEVDMGFTSEKVALWLSRMFGLDARRDSGGGVTFKLDGLREHVGDNLVSDMIQMKFKDAVEQRRELSKLRRVDGGRVFRMSDYR